MFSREFTQHVCVCAVAQVLEQAGPAFRGSDKIVFAVRQYLCVSLLKNCTSPLPVVVNLSLQVHKQHKLTPRHARSQALVTQALVTQALVTKALVSQALVTQALVTKSLGHTSLATSLAKWHASAPPPWQIIGAKPPVLANSPP